FSLTLGVLLISILLAIHRTESRQAFWLGFALFGWTSLVLSLVPSIEPRLLTTKGIAYLDSKVPGRSQTGFVRLALTGSGVPSNQVQNVAFIADGTQHATSSQGQVKTWSVKTGRLLSGWGGSTENFIRIGHSLFALLAGWCGGQLSRRLRRASRLPGPETAEH